MDKSGNGYFTIDQIKKVLFTYGEKLDEDEFKEFTKSITIQTDGSINNGNFMNYL